MRSWPFSLAPGQSNCSLKAISPCSIHLFCSSLEKCNLDPNEPDPATRELAAKDWEQFLYQRSKELKQGK